ncbi:MAG: CHAP domain-containing protein, partial [Saprospiraceae bacterium]|nr:CHAP domain-containing protein [Saprospiraceae bacterium]
KQQAAARSVQPFLTTGKASYGSRQVVAGGNKSSSLQPYIQPKTESLSGGVRPELKRAVAFAQSQVGKVDANKKSADGTRFGWQQLAEYFKSAMGPDKVVPDGGIQKPGSIMEKNIREKGKPIKAQKPNQPNPQNQENRDAMPSWCGIFVFWSLNKGGVPMPKWSIGGNAVSLKAAYPKSHIPRPGDIAYFGTNSHYAIVEKTEPENPDTKDIKKIKVSTVNGNTTGEDNLGGQVQVKSHPVSHWAGFFNPLFGLEDKMPKDPTFVTEAEIQQILGKSSAAAAANTTSNAAAITPYNPDTAPAPAAAVPVSKNEKAELPKTGEEPLAEEPVQEEKAAPVAEAPSPKSPAEDPAFQEVIKKTHGAKASEKKHGDAGEKSAAAQLASVIPN